MVVCHCHRVSDAHVEQVLDAGCPGLRGVVRATRAGSGCGSCLPQLRRLCEGARDGDRAYREVAGTLPGVADLGVGTDRPMELAG